jgi:hypothetical protein
MRIKTVAIWTFLAFATALCGQSAQSPDKNAKAILTAQIPAFELQHQTIADGIAKLSSGPIPLNIGFELVMRRKFADLPAADPHFDLKLEGATVREILTFLCERDARYEWSIDGTVINVRPRSEASDVHNLLNRTVDTLALTQLREPTDALLPIVKHFPPPEEQVGYAQLGGEISYGEPWTVTFNNMTVIQIINRLTAHLGSRAAWIWSGANDFRTFTFLKNGIPERRKEPEMK